LDDIGLPHRKFTIETLPDDALLAIFFFVPKSVLRDGLRCLANAGARVLEVATSRICIVRSLERAVSDYLDDCGDVEWTTSLSHMSSVIAYAKSDSTIIRVFISLRTVVSVIQEPFPAPKHLDGT